MSEIKMIFSAEDADLLRAVRRQEAQIESLKNKLKEAGREGRKANSELQKSAEDVGKGFEGATKWVRGFVGGFAGLAGVTSLLGTLRAEIDDLERRGQVAKNEALTVEQAQAKVINNMSGASQGQIDEVMASARGMAVQTGVQEQDILSALADAISASGGDVAAALAAVERSAQVNATDPAAIGQYAGTIIDLSKATGSADAGVNQGFLQWVGAMSRVVNPLQQAQNIPRAVIGGVNQGYDAVDTASLFAALTNASADFTGSSSSTATIALLEQMRVFFSEGAGKGKAAEGDFFGQLQALQTNQGLGQEFLEGLSLEKAAIGPVRQMILDATSQAAEALYTTRGAAPEDNAVFAERANNSLDALKSTAEAQLGVQQRQLEALNQRNVLGQAGGLGTAAVYDSAALDTTLSGAGLGFMDRTGAYLQYQGRRFLGGESNEEAFRGTLESVAENVARGERLAGVETGIDDSLRAVLDGLKGTMDNLNTTLQRLDAARGGGGDAGMALRTPVVPPGGGY